MKLIKTQYRTKHFLRLNTNTLTTCNYFPLADSLDKDKALHFSSFIVSQARKAYYLSNYSTQPSKAFLRTDEICCNGALSQMVFAPSFTASMSQYNLGAERFRPSTLRTFNIFLQLAVSELQKNL